MKRYSYSMAVQTAAIPIVDRGGSRELADLWDRFEYEYEYRDAEYEYEKKHEPEQEQIGAPKSPPEP